LELTLLERTDQFITEQQRSDGEVLARTLDRYGLEPIDGRVEQFVVWPQVPIVGRYDCILGYKGCPAMFDLKSGRSAVDYPHSTITQLALYAYAPRTSKTIVQRGNNWTCEDWGTMPDGLDLDTGYVILVGDDDEVGTLYALDLKHGYRAAMAAMELVTWRREHNYGRDLARPIQPEAETLRALAASIRAVDDAHANPVVGPPDEGTPVEAADFTPLEQRYRDLDPAAVEWFRGIVGQAVTAGVDFRAQQRKTVRRYEIYRGLIRLAEAGWTRDDQTIGLVEEATGDEAVNFANVTLGHAVGSMNAAEAAVFSKLVDDNVT
jgi:hypothetical protein